MNTHHGIDSIFSRRQFLASTAAAGALVMIGRDALAADSSAAAPGGKPNSVFGGVTIGINTYSVFIYNAQSSVERFINLNVATLNLDVTAPTITLEGDANGAPYPDPTFYRNKFSGKYLHRTIAGGVGHNLPQEAPQAFARAVIDVSGYAG